MLKIRKMRVLLISTVLYMIGVVVVLYARPSLMFDTDGRWKEFGLGGPASNTTIFPVWMFCISWAILSYLIVKMLVPEESNPVNVAALSALSTMLTNQPSGISRLQPSALSDTIEPLPTPTKQARMASPNKKQTGGTAKKGRAYYKLKKGADGESYFKFAGSFVSDEESDSSEED